MLLWCSPEWMSCRNKLKAVKWGPHKSALQKDFLSISSPVNLFQAHLQSAGSLATGMFCLANGFFSLFTVFKDGKGFTWGVKWGLAKASESVITIALFWKWILKVKMWIFQSLSSELCDTQTLRPSGCKTSMWNKSCSFSQRRGVGLISQLVYEMTEAFDKYSVNKISADLFSSCFFFFFLAPVKHPVLQVYYPLTAPTSLFPVVWNYSYIMFEICFVHLFTLGLSQRVYTVLRPSLFKYTCLWKKCWSMLWLLIFSPLLRTTIHLPSQASREKSRPWRSWSAGLMVSLLPRLHPSIHKVLAAHSSASLIWLPFTFSLLYSLLFNGHAKQMFTSLKLFLV